MNQNDLLNQSNQNQIGEGANSQENENNASGDDHFFAFENEVFKNNGQIKMFENDLFEIYIMKSFHKTQSNFKFQDAMFHVKIHVKNLESSIFFKDILNILEKIVQFALENLKFFVDLSYENICFLTIFQNPMLRGIRSTPFNLNEDASKGTANLLAKLNRYLVSNNELKLDESFLLYINILSLTHAEVLKKRKRKKLHYGFSSLSLHNYWCIDCGPELLAKFPTLKNKCLLISCIFANLQFKYFLSKKKDKQFQYAQNLHSTFKNKQDQAISILTSEIESFKRANALNEKHFDNGLDFFQYKESLSKYFNCQIVIFTGKELSSKILAMHPDEYDSSLKQFNLYASPTDKNHVAFIRHLRAYFNANVLSCIVCKNTYKSIDYKHKCLNQCFCCRQYLQNENTLVCPVIQDNFCDSLLVNEKSVECKVCNLSCKSNKCLNAHKKLCGTNGNLGYLCKTCNKFLYRNGSAYKNSLEIAQFHQCEQKFCRNCKEYCFFRRSSSSL